MQRELLEYPGRKLLTKDAMRVLERCLDAGKGAIKLAPRYTPREFNDPGVWARRRLSASALKDTRIAKGARFFRNNEWWGLNTVTPVMTGAKLKSNGEDPYKQGISFAHDPDGELMEFQLLIDADPNRVLGADMAEKSRGLYGIATAMIVSKRFANQGPIPSHLHFGGARPKIEVHDIIGADCPTVLMPHSECQAIGFKQEVDADAFIACMRRWGQKGGNGILGLMRWFKMGIGDGTFKCLPMMMHAPGAARGDVVQHEVHNLADQHGLFQDLMPNCFLTPAQAMAAVPQDILALAGSPDNWEFWASQMDYALNHTQDMMGQFFSPNSPAKAYCGDGVDAYWSCHGSIPGNFDTSILRLELKPGASITLKGLPSSGFYFLSTGQCRVAGLRNRMEYGLSFDGYVPTECGWMSKPLIDSGVEVENTGNWPAVLTMDFQEEVHVG